MTLDRRHIVHINVTHQPTAEWTALQLYQAFPFDTAPRFLVRDRDGIYGGAVLRALEQMGIQEKVITARSPWQNGYCERLVGTLKRECLNTTAARTRPTSRDGGRTAPSIFSECGLRTGRAPLYA